MHNHFLTDLDGTLLRSDASLSEYTINTISSALKKGIVISYATARSYISSQQVVSAIPWQYPIILYNGAVIFDPVAQKLLDGNWLETGTANDIISLGREYGLLPFLFALDPEDKERVLHERLSRAGDMQFFENRPLDPRFGEVPYLACPDTFRTLIVSYIGLLEELEPLKAEVQLRFGKNVHIHLMKDAYIANHYFLEFSHQKANKNEGLRKWSALMNCSPQDITVFGDNLNDVGMFEAAGTRIAVSNAHPALIEMSTLVAASNDEDGVAKYISIITEENRLRA
ncbi:HAD family hydrolase [Paenibacillus sp. sgz302251]|uniref:HAD family hydrolase n=1 Tax=Paenibacillus sp. sgz302251 TaxID=3414493 RepID=UPI003C7D2CE6